ncbi:unnamed protein product, partial [Amoebophrya sp. A120]
TFKHPILYDQWLTYVPDLKKANTMEERDKSVMPQTHREFLQQLALEQVVDEKGSSWVLVEDTEQQEVLVLEEAGEGHDEHGGVAASNDY